MSVAFPARFQPTNAASTVLETFEMFHIGQRVLCIDDTFVGENGYLIGQLAGILQAKKA
jgi:hypothetical protein